MSIEVMELFKKLQTNLQIEDAVVVYKTKAGNTRIVHTDMSIADICVCKGVLDYLTQNYLFPPTQPTKTKPDKPKLDLIT